jgi:transcription antitermination factor NusG
LIEHGFQSFLPLIQSRCDSVPLFTSYVFVRSARMEGPRTLDVPGLLYLVNDGSAPLAIPDVEIESLRIALASRLAQPCGFIGEGTEVIVMAGPLAGLRGRVIRSQPTRVFVSVDLLRRSLMVEMHPAMIQIE